MTPEDLAALRIRASVADDIAVCAGLDHSVTTEYVWQMEVVDIDGTLNASFRTAHLPRSMTVRYPRDSDMRRKMLAASEGLLVAELHRQVVGYVNLYEQPAQERCWVTDLAVSVEHRRQGVGTLLLRGARSWVSQHGYRRLIVEAATKNYPAICFMQKNGLTFCGYNDLYFTNHDIAIFFGQSLR